MLSDPLTVKVPSLVGASTLTILDTLTFARLLEHGGGSLYKGTASATDQFTRTATVRHSRSNENKPVATNRLLVRVDANGIFADGKPALASAYLVCIIPEQDMYANQAAVTSGDVFTWNAHLGALLGFFAVNSADSKLNTAILDRLVAGES
jgi:hypothetical protein